MVNENPWIEQHIVAETDFQGHFGRRMARKVATQLVRNEYRWAPNPIQCSAGILPNGNRCTGMAYYKATIGAMECPDCNSLYHCNGDVI